MHASRSVALASLAVLGIATAWAQQPAPPPPSFAPSDLSPAGVRALAANCAACHGTDGRAVKEGDPLGLAGMSSERIVLRMTQYKTGEVPATVMHQLAKGFSDAEIAALAGYFSNLPR